MRSQQTLAFAAAAGAVVAAAAEFKVCSASFYSKKLTDARPLQPTTLTAPFLEQFTPDWTQRWVVSQATKQTPVGDETFSYVGKWNVEPPSVYPGIDGDEGLVLSEYLSFVHKGVLVGSRD